MTDAERTTYDVVIVGGGNAALCAALSASEHKKKILVLERAPEDEAGGNSRFTAGLFRIVYTGPEDLKTLIPDLSADEIANTDFGTYTEEQFLDDMARVTEYRCDPDLTEILVKQSLPTAQWMRKRGVRFTAAWGRQASRSAASSSSGAASPWKRSAAGRGWWNR